MNKQKEIIINYLIEDKLKEFTSKELLLDSVSLLKKELYDFYLNDKDISSKIDNTVLFANNFFSILENLNSNDFLVEFIGKDTMVFNNIFEYSHIYSNSELRIIHYDEGFRLRIKIDEEKNINCLFTVDANKKEDLVDLNTLIPKIPSYFNYLSNYYKENTIFSYAVSEQIVSLEKKLKLTEFEFLNSSLRSDIQGSIINTYDMAKIIKEVKEMAPLTSLVNDFEIHEEIKILDLLTLKRPSSKLILKS